MLKEEKYKTYLCSKTAEITDGFSFFGRLGLTIMFIKDFNHTDILAGFQESWGNAIIFSL